MAVATSMLSTPLPKLAISLSCSPDLLSTEASIRSVTVGTRTSAVFTASASWLCVMGLSSGLRRVSKSSRIRSSTESGSLRVTITSGFFVFAIDSELRIMAAVPPGSGDLALINPARRHCASGEILFFLPDGPDKTKLPDRVGCLRIGGGYRGTAAPACPVGRGCCHRLGQRLADPALRQPQIRPGQCPL